MQWLTILERLSMSIGEQFVLWLGKLKEAPASTSFPKVSLVTTNSQEYTKQDWEMYEIRNPITWDGIDQ